MLKRSKYRGRPRSSSAGPGAAGTAAMADTIPTAADQKGISSSADPSPAVDTGLSEKPRDPPPRPPPPSADQKAVSNPTEPSPAVETGVSQRPRGPPPRPPPPCKVQTLIRQEKVEDGTPNGLDDTQSGLDDTRNNVDDTQSVGKDIESVGKDTESVDKDTANVHKDTPSVGKDLHSVGKDTESVGKDIESVGKDTPSVDKDTANVDKDIESVDKDTANVDEKTQSVGNDTVSVGKDIQSLVKDTPSVDKDTPSVDKDTQSVGNDTQSVGNDTQSAPVNNEVQVNGTEDVSVPAGDADGRPPVEEKLIKPSKSSKISRGSNLRKLIKRSKSNVGQSDGDNISLGSNAGDDMDTTPAAALPPTDTKSRSNSLRKRLALGHQTGSTSSISSRESVSSEEPGAILTRQLSRKNSQCKNNPINENNFTRLLLLFLSTLLGWLLKFFMFLWTQGVGFFADPPEAVEGEAAELPAVEQPGIIPLKPEITAPGKERIFFICNELTNTEQVYVDRLQLLVMAKERATAIVGADVAKQMFKDVEVISLFHSNYLLPDLKERMAHWEEHRKIGDIMRKLTPYLKLYTDYVKDFQKAEALVDYWENKSSAFAAMIRDIRDTQAARHGKLKVQAHMIEPIQRVPRYELLLRDYLKRLPDDAPDKSDTEKALVSVSQAACHFENVMKRDSRIAKLIEIRERLDSFVNIVLPTREFICETRLNIFSQRTLKPSEKTTFLFNDLFLVCSQQKMQKIMTSMKLKVKVAIDLREAELISGTNLDIPYTLWVQTKDETHTEICLSSVNDMAQWRQTLQGLIDAFTKTLLRNSTCSSMDSIDGEEAVESVHEGHVQVSSDDARTWRRRWVVIGTCGRLFAFKTQQDKTPLSWIRIVRFNLESAHNSKKANTLVLQGFGRKYFLHFESQNDYNEWFEVLQRYQESSSPDGLEETSVEDEASA